MGDLVGSGLQFASNNTQEQRNMNNLRGAICRSQPLIASSCHRFRCIISQPTIRVSLPNYKPHRVSIFSDVSKGEPWLGFNHQRRTLIQAANWTDGSSPYDILGIHRHISYICICFDLYELQANSMIENNDDVVNKCQLYLL